MDEKQQFWNVFAQTGRVEDYLRYCRCSDTPEQEEHHDQIVHRRLDHPGDTRGRSG